MKRILRAEKFYKTFIITDEGTELLIEVSRKTTKDTEYLNLTGEERLNSLEGWKELDKSLRAQLQFEKSKKENVEKK